MNSALSLLQAYIYPQALQPATQEQISSALTEESYYLEGRLQKYKDQILAILQVDTFSSFAQVHAANLQKNESLELSLIRSQREEVISKLDQRISLALNTWRNFDSTQIFLLEKLGYSISQAKKPISGKHWFTKSGSDLSIILTEDHDPIKFQFIHTIHATNFKLWLYAHEEGIPVARILGYETTGLFSKVISCFEGVDLDRIPEYFRISMPEVMENISQQKNRLIQTVRSAGIDHGHLHTANFTVLFYSKHELSNLDTRNINLVRPNEITCSYNFVEVMRDPNSWIPIVRLIDWDAASWRTSDELET